MVAGTSRRLAGGLVVATLGSLGIASTAQAQTSGGLSITPAVLENRARLGKVGKFTLKNTTKETLRVTVNVRPWRQQLDGKVAADPRATYNRYVRANVRSFTIRGGAKRTITLRMVRRPPGGSLYGGINVFGKPTKTRGRTGIIPQYNLVSSLRLNPRKRTIRLRTGSAQIRGRAVILPIRNLGNTISPVGGSFRISGPTTRSGNFKSVGVVPGRLVGLNLTGTRGLKKGRYTVNATVTQAGRRITTRTSFVIR
jgi:hypothetical protein